MAMGEERMEREYNDWWQGKAILVTGETLTIAGGE